MLRYIFKLVLLLDSNSSCPRRCEEKAGAATVDALTIIARHLGQWLIGLVALLFNNSLLLLVR